MPAGNHFGGNLRWLRRMHGYTLQELAGEAHIAMATIGQIENGADCRLSTALTLAATLGVGVDSMSWEDPMVLGQMQEHRFEQDPEKMPSACRFCGLDERNPVHHGDETL